VICLVAAIAIIFFQFRSRKSKISWLILASTVLAVGILVLLPAMTDLTDSFMPRATSGHPLPAKLALDHTVAFNRDSKQSLEFFGNQVRVVFPIHLDNFAEGTLLKIRGVKLDLDLPTTEHWTSKWQSLQEVVFPARTRIWPWAEVSRKILERYANSVVNAHLTLSVDVYRLGESHTLAISGNYLELPGGTHCGLGMQRTYYAGACFSPLRNMGPFLIEAKLPNEECQQYSGPHVNVGGLRLRAVLFLRKAFFQILT